MTNIKQLITDNPGSNFLILTHVDRPFPFPDYIIRRFLSKRHSIPMAQCFSHCGVAWLENGEPTFFHQTYPHYKQEPFSPRRYNVAYKIDSNVENVRAQARKGAEEQKRYSIPALVFFAVTMWFSWMNNPKFRAKVCSTAMARLFKNLLPDKWYDYDPQELDLHLMPLGLPRYVEDRR